MLVVLATTVAGESPSVTGVSPSAHHAEYPATKYASIFTTICSWGPESAKKPNTKQYVDSLKNMNKLLENRVKVLEERLSRCTSQSYSEPAPEISAPPLRIPDRASPYSSDGYTLSPVSSHSGSIAVKTEEQEDAELEQRICAPTQLPLGNGGLLYGLTSIFRWAPRTPERSPLNEELLNGGADVYLAQEKPLFDSDIDWARHLPEEVPLTRAEHDRLLDLLFRFFTSWGLRVIPQLFQRDMQRCLSLPGSQPPLKTAHYSPMLHNAMLAVATAFSDDPMIKDPAARRQFADSAKSYLEDECELPKLSAMTALSLLANYHSSENHPTLGYIYFGISARMSQALGLGLDCSPWVEARLISQAGMLDRNWALWTTFCQDTTWSLYVGRDFCTNFSEEAQAIPVPFVGADLDQPLGSWSSTEKERPSYISGTFGQTCALLRIAREIADVVSNFSRLGVRHEADEFRIGQMDLKLSTWKNSLPPEIDFAKSSTSVPHPHQIMLHMTYHWLSILLHRPFYRRRRFEDANEHMDHIKPCNKAAAEIMELAGIWRRHYSLRYVPITIIQVISAAATIFVLAAVQAVSGPRIAHGALESSQKNAEMAILFLREVGMSFASAVSIADILQNLLEEQVMTRIARRSPGLPPSQRSPSIASSWQEPNPQVVFTATGFPTDSNPHGSTLWAGSTFTPVNSTYSYFPDSQQAIGYPNYGESSLSKALETPLSYHQPFGDGLGESPGLPAGVSIPGMNFGSVLRGDAVFTNDSWMMLGSPQDPFGASYQSQMGSQNMASR
ncbi:hypothetical protein BC834DRAFT_973601 [Gloeopeniophorella convolvens]|nr:hypothetical protein BC834DRAFT_973601 [Gloeopeniophorella convolvens]